MADPPSDPSPEGETPVAADRKAPAPTSRWATAFGIIALVLVLLFVALQVMGGNHGPSRHAPPTSDTGHGARQPPP